MESVRLRKLHFDVKGWVMLDKLARLGPADEMAERAQPRIRVVRRHGIDESDDEFGRQRREPLVTIPLAEALEDGPTLDRRAAIQPAEGARGKVFGERARHTPRCAACAGADRDWGSREGGLISEHKLARAGDARKTNAGMAATAEVMIPAEALHVFEMELGHC